MTKRKYQIVTVVFNTPNTPELKLNIIHGMEAVQLINGQDLLPFYKVKTSEGEFYEIPQATILFLHMSTKKE